MLNVIKNTLSISEMIKKIRINQEKDAKGGGKQLIFFGSYANFLHNGGLVLEESISFFHGKTNPVRCFSVDELNTMALDRDSYVLIDGFSKWYKGLWDGRPVMVRSHDRIRNYGCGIECVIREIVVATQMGAHQNVHRLLGYCLETDLPVLIYEWIGSETLAERVIDNENKNKSPLEWKDRIRIACEISHAIAYLHTAFPRPIIHKDLKPATVFLTPDNTAKVFDFSLSISIPDGEEFVQPDKLIGCFSYLAPEYVMEGRVAKSSDVYAFGVIFLVLLTGKASIFSLIGEGDTKISLVYWVKEALKKNCINEIVDPFIFASKVTNSELLNQQLRASIKLALQCTEKDEGKRPTMMEIGTALQNMMKSLETVS